MGRLSANVDKDNEKFASLVLSCVINGNYVKVGACQEKRLKLPVANKNGRFSSG